MASEPTFTNILEAKTLEVLLVQLQGLLYQMLGLYRGYIEIMEGKWKVLFRVGLSHNARCGCGVQPVLRFEGSWNVLAPEVALGAEF